MMNGCNPTVLKRCYQLPKKFPVKNSVVAGHLTRGLTLDQEMKVMPCLGIPRQVELLMYIWPEQLLSSRPCQTFHVHCS